MFEINFNVMYEFTSSDQENEAQIKEIRCSYSQVATFGGRSRKENEIVGQVTSATEIMHCVMSSLISDALQNVLGYRFKSWEILDEVMTSFRTSGPSGVR